MDEWQSRWDESKNCRITYGFIPDIRFMSGVPEVSFTMRKCFLLTGHGLLSGFLVGRNLMEDSSCVCDEQVDTAMHVLCICPLYADIRNLDALQITLHENNHDVRYCLSTQESRNSVEEFAQRLSREDTSLHTGNGDKEVGVVSQWMCYLIAFGHDIGTCIGGLRR